MAKLYALYLLMMGFFTFLAYAADKHRAKKGAWRISEKVLLTLSLVGGALGGLLGMRLCRHKTAREHWYFTAVNLLGIILHAAALVLLWIYF